MEKSTELLYLSCPGRRFEHRSAVTAKVAGKEGSEAAR